MKHVRYALLIAVALAFGLNGAAQAQSVLRVVANDEPPTLDSTNNIAAAIASLLLYNTFETLVQIGDDGGLEPLLAESWELSEDGRTYTFHLHDGVRFHDGSPLTADDVVWSFLNGRDKEGHVQKFAFSTMVSAEAPDPLTVVVVLEEPNSVFLQNIAKRAGHIMAERHMADMANNPVGSGPFKFVEWNRGESLVFERFDDYWGEPARVDRLEWVIIPDANAETNALLAGDVDAVQTLNALSRVGEFQRSDDFVVEPGDYTSVYVISVNHEAPPFDNPRVRAALVHAVDSQALIVGANNGFGTETHTFSSKVDAYFTPDYVPYPYDPERAREILKEEGVEGVEVEIHSIIDNPSIRQAEILMGQLFAAGFRPTIGGYDLGTGLNKLINDRDYQISPVGIISERITRVTCENPWFQNYCNPEFDKLIAQARTGTTPEEINAAYEAAVKLAADDVVVVPLFTAVRVGVHADYVKGWRAFHPDTVLDLRGVYIER